MSHPSAKGRVDIAFVPRAVNNGLDNAGIAWYKAALCAMIEARRGF
jgi:hypothetical protein